MKPYLLTKSHIEKTWDLEEEDWDSGVRNVYDKVRIVTGKQIGRAHV